MAGVACPVFSCVGGVVEGGLVAVAERVGNQRRWCGRDELGQCLIAGSSEVDPEFVEPGHDGVGVQVLSGAFSGKQPWAVLVGGGQVRPFLGVLTDQVGEWFR